jgi:hypothetical protein
VASTISTADDLPSSKWVRRGFRKVVVDLDGAEPALGGGTLM